MSKAICVKCKFHTGKGRSIWDHQCKHPNLTLKPVTCPVTGERKYNHGGVLMDEKFPDCVRINSGHCELFQKRRFLRAEAEVE